MGAISAILCLLYLAPGKIETTHSVKHFWNLFIFNFKFIFGVHFCDRSLMRHDGLSKRLIDSWSSHIFTMHIFVSDKNNVTTLRSLFNPQVSPPKKTTLSLSKYCQKIRDLIFYWYFKTSSSHSLLTYAWNPKCQLILSKTTHTLTKVQKQQIWPPDADIWEGGGEVSPSPSTHRMFGASNFRVNKLQSCLFTCIKGIDHRALTLGLISYKVVYLLV